MTGAAINEREEKFETMLASVQASYAAAVRQIQQRKEEAKAKTVRYRELMGEKLTYQNMLSIYRPYGLL